MLEKNYTDVAYIERKKKYLLEKKNFLAKNFTRKHTKFHREITQTATSWKWANLVRGEKIRKEIRNLENRHIYIHIHTQMYIYSISNNS